jgi:hypothetical protein
MGFLDHAKRRAQAFGLKRHASDIPSSASDEKLEPQLNPHDPALEEASDPEARRMAQTFEALYSPPAGPTEDSATWTENDNVFADAPHGLNLADAGGGAAFLKHDPGADSKPHTSAAWPDDAVSAQNRKTTIEMADERRRGGSNATLRAAMRWSESPAVDWTSPGPARTESGLAEASDVQPRPTAQPRAAIRTDLPGEEEGVRAESATFRERPSVQARMGLRTLIGAAV